METYMMNDERKIITMNNIEQMIQKFNKDIEDRTDKLRIAALVAGIAPGSKVHLKDGNILTVLNPVSVINVNGMFYVSIEARPRKGKSLIQVHTVGVDDVGDIVQVDTANKDYFYKFNFKTIPPIAVKGNVFMGVYHPKGPVPNEKEVVILPQDKDGNYMHRLEFNEGDYVKLVDGVTLTEPVIEIIKIHTPEYCN